MASASKATTAIIGKGPALIIARALRYPAQQNLNKQ